MSRIMVLHVTCSFGILRLKEQREKMQKEMEADVKATVDRSAELRLKVTQLQDEIMALQVGCSFSCAAFFQSNEKRKLDSVKLFPSLCSNYLNAFQDNELTLREEIGRFKAELGTKDALLSKLSFEENEQQAVIEDLRCKLKKVSLSRTFSRMILIGRSF